MRSTKKWKILKWSLITLVSLCISLFVFGYWFMSLIRPDLAERTDHMETILPTDLPYLASDSVPYRGKILAVVTSVSTMGSSGKPTGYELTEMARAYYIFTANGYEVDIASPKGGVSPVVIDDDDVDVYDYAFLNDVTAAYKTRNTLPIRQVVAADYQAVYFVGGKGAMFDFPNDSTIQALVRTYYETDKVIGAVCHGPAALVNCTLSNGQPLLADKQVSGFTNEEELFLISEAYEIFPFMLQSRLAERGATFYEGPMYLENVVADGNLITGQNPWSTWKLAETMVQQLGHTPKARTKTAEENAVMVLNSYYEAGYTAAKETLNALHADSQLVKRELIGVHGIVSVMQLDLRKTIHLIRLLVHKKALDNEMDVENER